MTSDDVIEEKTDEKWGSYGETVLEFPGPPALRIDLRRPLDDVAREAVRRLGLHGTFAVLTAENPAGQNPEDAPSKDAAEQREARNERRTSRLEQALAEAGVSFVAVDGSAPDGSYRERCVAAPMPRREAVELARRLDQLALFWFDGRDFWLLPAEADAEPERLPRTKRVE
jgi:hypothetical protein